MHTTRTDAEQDVIAAIESPGSDVEDARAEFDIDSIVDEVYEYSADLQAFVQTADTDEFWDAVMRHAR